MVLVRKIVNGVSSSLTGDEDVYNALTIHGLATAPSLPTSVLDIAGFWNVTCYNIGGLTYSLDDLEHGLLRGNKPHPSTGAVCFQLGDRRLEFAIPELDPRIHFALVCGARVLYGTVPCWSAWACDGCGLDV